MKKAIKDWWDNLPEKKRKVLETMWLIFVSILFIVFLVLMFTVVPVWIWDHI